ncbi:MAG: hypothetical protein A3C07_01230 [Candidatus Sungbacteria bacterium RIFCSPHIGHO2_02_FULL_47_11]|uniref:DUF5671 domain-containing protein n=1 Tax=Candidatus Sungbacteria bacterium RIFCSPHIGHO2_02_FULL_47_11 TaxID=1802270 RepID=A0A1G2KPN3_9BACT|nr:MAG: hypothetical protein A3C07_01230 [Candidatus Sungbacteria bacterium RIFCSPHIGHO2_02_FULL_47_11]
MIRAVPLVLYMVLAIFPFWVRAQDTPIILFNVRTVVETILAIFFLGSLLLFGWGLLRFKFSKDPVVKTKAKDLMERGAIGAVAMAATWGLAIIIVNILGIPSEIPPP